MPELRIGTARAQAGAITHGWFEAFRLPTGESERFPITIACGQADGPVAWITTGIHGDEHTGLAVLHHLITPELVESLHGTLIAVLSLSPAGLRTRKRIPYTATEDPNRLFPSPIQGNENEPLRRKPRGLEGAYARLYQLIVTTAPACLVDLHNAWIGSVPFVFRDPVFFGKDAGGRTRRDAARLLSKVDSLIEATGLTPVNEFAASSYLDMNLHRSVSGAVLNGAGIPAVTIELGSRMYIDGGVVEACAAGLRNVLRASGLLEGQHEPVTGVPVIRPGYPVRRHMGPTAPDSGIVQFLVRPGDAISEGQVVARLVDIFGEPVGPDSGLLRSEHDGFVLGWPHGVVRYEGEAVLALAIRDERDLLVPA